jgi:hypothetical protein
MELQYERIYESVTGGWVDLHPLHGKDELRDNLIVCKLLADWGYQLQLLPCLNESDSSLRQQLLPDVSPNKNPDVRINYKIIADIKTPYKTNVTKTALKGALYRAAQQKVSTVILNLFQSTYSFTNLKDALLATLAPDRNRSIKEVWLITFDNNLLIIPRKMINTRRFYEVLNCL